MRKQNDPTVDSRKPHTTALMILKSWVGTERIQLRCIPDKERRAMGERRLREVEASIELLRVDGGHNKPARRDQ
jgi:hypothetical protein